MKALVLALLLPSSAHAAYNVSVSTAYAKTWYSTTGTGLPFGQVTHVNSSLASPPGPYTWYWKLGATFTNDGNGLVPARLGRNCANFVSQCLKAGGVVMSGDTGQGATFIGAARLGAALRSIATVSTFTTPSGIPGNLTAGDVIVWNQAHATIVSSGGGSGVKLAAHTWDRFDAPLGIYFDHFMAGRSYHITGTTITVSADVTAPTMNIFNYQNFLIPNGGWGNGYTFSANVSDSGDGVAWLEVVVSTPILDSEVEVSQGLASYVYTDPTSYGASHTYSVSLYSLSDGTTAYFQAFDGAGNLNLQSFRLDRVSPSVVSITDTADNPINGATSSTTVKVTGSDALSGAYTITLSSSGGTPQVSTNSTPAPNVPYTATFSGLTDGQYTATVADQANNQASVSFTIDTSGSSPGAGAGSTPSSSTAPITNNQCLVLRSSNTLSNICQIWSDFSPSTAVFSGGASTGTYALSICGVSTGTYTIYAKTCAGVVSSTQVVISSAEVRETLTGSGAGWSASNSVAVGGMATLQASFLAVADTTSCGIFAVTAGGKTLTCNQPCGGCQVQYSASFGPPAQSYSWQVTNISPNPFTSAITFTGGVAGYTNQITFNAAPHPYTLSAGASLSGNVTIPEVSNATYTYTLYASTLSVSSPYIGVILSTRAALTGAEEYARLRQVLRRSGHIVEVTADGGAAVFNSTMTLRLEYTDASVDTTTARMYRLSGSTWESSSMFNQTISRSSNDITAVGLSTFTSTFVVFFDGHDSSAPVTTFAIQGSSFIFDQALFISTDAFIVLTATDPAVSGYASTVASITYRLDPSPGSPFSIYSSSISLPLGTHVFEYRSLDYAGNTEVVQTTTFTVTAGTAFRTANTAQTPGIFLNGFSGSSAKLEIESRGENATTLLISSVNRLGLLSVDNIGEVGIGVTPRANLNIGVAPIALQLRSGNSTSAVTSNQIALGYNGDYSMRHLMRTEHSTAAHGNKLDFLVWNTGAGSTMTVASLNTLSLQGITAASGGSFHVQPVGEPDAEVEVSNGLSTGGGTMQRLQVVAPSSRRFKTDIKDQREKDENQALSDVAALKHAKFRYLTRRKDGSLIEDPAQPLHTGLIYEEAPDSIRDGKDALSTSERLVNVEMALKASMRRLEELQKRYDELKARRKSQ